jgi:hypothetical protein
MVNDQALLKSLYAWSKEKIKFKEDEVIFAITWMKENEFAPIN